MQNTLKHSEPIFIVGMNGSGTTMLLDCLGRHPQLYGFPLHSRVISKMTAGSTRGEILVVGMWMS